MTLACVAALSIHALLFVSGWLLLKQISVPSNKDRVMVLTIEPAPEDRFWETKKSAVATMNEVAVDEPSSMLAEPHPAKPSKSTPTPSKSTPTPSARSTARSSPELKPDQVADRALISQDQQAKSRFEENHGESTPAIQSILADPSQALDHSNGATEIAGLENADTLMTSQRSKIAVNHSSTKNAEGLTNSQVVDIQQRRMIEKEVEQWTRKLGGLEKVDLSHRWQHQGQTYLANFTELPAPGEMGLDRLLVEVSTIANGQAISTAMHFKKLAFSSFAQFIHHWDPFVMIHDDEMNGRFHSNSQILLTSDSKKRPVFHGKVTTTSYTVNFDRRVRRNTKKMIFKGGLETGVKKIPMPKPQWLFADAAVPNPDHTILFESNTRIVFTAEGGFIWQPIKEAGGLRYQALPDHSLYLVANPGVALFVSGKVRGKVIVYSPERVIIEGDITYARDDVSETDDVLGIISDKDVVIARENITGVGDLHIHGSIYARRRFKVRDYSKPHTGTLHIFGSLCAGSMSATQPRYATSITFDERFEWLRPPGFPVTNQYEMMTTDAVWLFQ